MKHFKRPHIAVVGMWKFVPAPTYVLGDNLSYDFFAVPGCKVVSKTELELWAKTTMSREVYYLPE